MTKLSALRSLEGFRSLIGSTSRAMKTANPKPSSDAGGSSYGSFPNLKIIADKLVREQASVKTILERARTKLRTTTEQINLLEGKFQQTVNENAKLKVKQNEDSKLWQGLDSKISSTKTSDAGGSSCGSITNLKITAEKLFREQASVKTDLEMAHTQLRRTTEQINLLEGKLQQAVSENAKLKVKQNEDSKLWQGLDSKISSTKTLCDQLTETLQQLASQTEQAEEDKNFFEEMLGKNLKAMDEFNCLLHDLTTKLECAQEKIISGKQEMLQIKQEKEEMDRSYKEQLCSNDATIKEKDSLIKQLEGSVDENKSRLICLDSRLQCMEQELKLKDDVCISLKENLASSESEKNSLELRNQGCIVEIEKLCKDNKDLNKLLSSFMAKITELDREHASMSGHMSRLLCSFERFYEMAEEEKMLVARSSKNKFEHLQQQYVDLSSENDALKIEIEELKSRIIELQKTQEIAMVQHVEECQVADGKVRRLESEAEISASNINRLEKLASELPERIQKLLEDSTLAENHKQELLEKILKLESDNQELQVQMQSIIEEKSNNAESLQGEITKCDQQVDTLENQINQLRCVLNEEKLCSCSLEREKTLEDRKLQVEASLTAAEWQLSEAKKQYDLMLEGKQIELSKHLKELSLKNDQAINEIRKKYELEKVEISNDEKEKAEKLIREMESKSNEKISENKHDSERHLMRLKEEHGTMVARIQQDNELKESTLRAYHKEELQRIQSHAENEPKEHMQLRRTTEQINLLEGKLQQAVSENAKLKVKQNEDSKLWQGLDSKISSTKTLCDQLTETLQQLASQTEQAEEDKKLFEEMLGKNLKAMDEFNCLLHDLTTKLECAQQKIISGKQELMDRSYMCSNDATLKGKEKLVKERASVYGGLELAMANSVRTIHSKAYKDNSNSKRKKEPTHERYPGNTATIILDLDNLEATQRSYKRAIRKARAWCRANTKITDLSKCFGPGAEIYTTPAKGTFHMTFEHKERKLTLFLYGRDLYMKGWQGDRYGSFQIEKNFMPDPRCPFLDTGVNYHDLCQGGEVANVSIGPEALIRSFETLHKCNGVVTTDLLRSIAMFAVGTAEAIRQQDVFVEYTKTFDDSGKVNFLVKVGSTLSFSIRTYSHYSKEYLKWVDKNLSGKSPEEILNRGVGKVKFVEELRQRIRVPLRISIGEGEFKLDATDEEPERWSPPYPDGKDWGEYEEMQLDNDEIKYWPFEGLELENIASEDNKEEEIKRLEDLKVQKPGMNIRKYHSAAMQGSISRFCTSIASSSIGSGGQYMPFFTAPGRIEGSRAKTCFIWRPHGLSGWRH